MKTFDYKDLELILAHNENGLYTGANLRYSILDRLRGQLHNQAVWVQNIQDVDRVRAFFLQDNIEVINVRSNLANTAFAGYLVKLGASYESSIPTLVQAQ